MAYNSAYTGSQVDAAVGAVRQKETIWDGKQDELTGTEDQLVGFNSAGEAVAVAKPDPLPAGGETGQVLTKTAEGTAWDDIPSDLPAGGTDGQILTKTADGVAWEDAPAVGVTSFKGRTGAVTPQEGDYTADMVGARPDTWTPSASDVGAVPTSRTVNGHALSNNITLDAADVGAVPTQTGTQGQVLGFTADNTVGAMDAPSGLPSGGTTGQMLYQGESGAEWGDKPVMYVNITGNDDTGFTADKTAKEILDLINDGFFVVAKCSDGQENSPYFYAPMVQKYVVGSTGEESYINLSFCSFADGSILVANHTYTPGFEQAYFSIATILSSNVSFTPGTTGLTADNVQDAIEEVNEKVVESTSTTITLTTSGWTGSAAPYSQQVSCSIVAADTAVVAVDVDTPGTDADADAEAINAWALCTQQNPTQGAGTLTFYCTEKPTINIPVKVGVS